ncbi:hypothetical protein ONJ16_25315, partial [Salmonella enterica subsp. enterica serovar Montevideo]|nr:hypothetical protein [Salmonella enterica subsp. enterica serovar Montevideo]
AKYGVIAAAKRHVRNQESPDGQKWPGRKTKRKGKMLRNLPKLIHLYSLSYWFYGARRSPTLNSTNSVVSNLRGDYYS